MNQQAVRKAVIAAAGFGTRFLPQTKAMPKEMLPLVDKPIIQHIVEDLVTAGIQDIIIVTGYSKRSIEDHFDTPNEDLLNNLRFTRHVEASNGAAADWLERSENVPAEDRPVLTLGQELSVNSFFRLTEPAHGSAH